MQLTTKPNTGQIMQLPTIIYSYGRCCHLAAFQAMSLGTCCEMADAPHALMLQQQALWPPCVTITQQKSLKIELTIITSEMVPQKNLHHFVEY
jgi:hypothetical protein